MINKAELKKSYLDKLNLVYAPDILVNFINDKFKEKRYDIVENDYIMFKTYHVVMDFNFAYNIFGDDDMITSVKENGVVIEKYINTNIKKIEKSLKQRLGTSVKVMEYVKHDTDNKTFYNLKLKF